MLKFARRAFLSAIAGVWGLSWTEQQEVYLSNSVNGETNQDEPRLVHRSTGEIDSNFVAQQRSINTTVDVVVYPDHYQPVGLELKMDGLDMGAALTAEDAEELGKTLISAANHTE